MGPLTGQTYVETAPVWERRYLGLIGWLVCVSEERGVTDFGLLCLFRQFSPEFCFTCFSTYLPEYYGFPHHTHLATNQRECGGENTVVIEVNLYILISS